MKLNEDIEKLVSDFNINPASDMRSHVLDDALKIQERKLAQNKSDDLGCVWKIVLSGKMFKLAVAAVIFLVIGILLLTSTNSEMEVDKKIVSSQSPIDLMTAISLERAFKQGGIEAVYEQFGRAYPRQSYQSNNPSVNEIFKELETFENNF